MDRYECKNDSMSKIIMNFVLFCILILLLIICNKIDNINGKIKELSQHIEITEMENCKTKVKWCNKDWYIV